MSFFFIFSSYARGNVIIDRVMGNFYRFEYYIRRVHFHGFTIRSEFYRHDKALARE